MEGRSVLNVRLKTVSAYNVVWMKCNYICNKQIDILKMKIKSK